MIALLQKIAAIAVASVLVQGAVPSFAQQSQPQPPSGAKSEAPERQTSIRVTSELVLVNVVVRDKKGNLVRDLKKEDFTLLEDGKKQAISTFDFENVDEMIPAGTAEATVSGTAPDGALLRSKDQPASLNARDR